MCFSQHEVESDDDERDAQQLAHIERHALLEVYLLFLDELDEEAEGEDGCQAESEIESSAYRHA